MQISAQAAQPTAVPYPQMVTNLFKTMSTDALTLLHATVGMAGETAELLDCYRDKQVAIDSRELSKWFGNMVKEMGDWRFYAQAVWNIYGWEWDSFVLTLPGSTRAVPIAIQDMIIHSGAILDMSKKAWAYESEVDARVLYEKMEHALSAYRDVLFFMGWTDEYICAENRTKLGGVYSNTDAIARADKAEEFQPVGA